MAPNRAINLLPMRRFPAPWTVEKLDAGFKIVDANGQSLAYVYGHADPRDAATATPLGSLAFVSLLETNFERLGLAVNTPGLARSPLQRSGRL